MEEQIISIFPEKRVEYANFGYRLGAILIDWILLGIAGFIIQKIIGGRDIYKELIAGNVPTSSIVGQLVSLVVGILYFVIMESSAAQATIGKQAVGILVTNMDGNRISVGQATGRYFSKWLSSLILFIGYLMNTWDDKGQTLHDKMAGTLVVKKG